TVLGQTMIAQGGGDRSNPQIAVDPLDPQRAVSVWFDRILPVPTSPPRVVAEGAFTTNGGQTWLNFFLPPNLIDPGSSPMNPQPYDHATMPSVGFDRNHNFYVVYAEHNNDVGAGYVSTGAVILQKYDFTSGVPVKITLPDEAGFSSGKLLYQWRNQDSAVLPTLVVDNTVSAFTDPDTGRTQTNPSAGTIYVAFGTQNTAPQNAQNFNPNVIRVMASSDGGQSWGASTYPVSSVGGFGFP